MNHTVMSYHEYQVKKGDSLYEIAKQFNTTVDALIEANMLVSTLIYPGQKLLIPSNDIITLEHYHTVESDTIESICQRFNVSFDTLQSYNDLGKLGLLPNQVINIPMQVKTYQIKERESLDNLLKINNLTPYELLTRNQDLLLKPGTIIKI